MRSSATSAASVRRGSYSDDVSERRALTSFRYALELGLGDRLLVHGTVAAKRGSVGEQ